MFATHSRMITLILTLAATGTLVGGCNGPTKAGQQARIDARERLDRVNSSVTFDQARQSFEVGQFDRALREIDAAIARYPKESQFHLLRGRILLEMNRLDVAMRSFETAMEHDELAAEPHYRAGIILQRWAQHDKALEAYKKAFELEESHAPYLSATVEGMIAMEQYDEAKALITEHKAFFEHNVALRVLEAQLAMLTNQPIRAVELLTQARLMNPDDAMLLEELAILQFEAQMFGDCLESLRERKGTLAESRPDLTHLEARCLAEMGRTEEARNLYIKLTYQKDSEPDLWADFGFLAWEMGDFMRVSQCASRLVALAPERHEGYLLKGVHARHRGDHGEALRHFWDATQRAPELSMPYVMLGHTFEFLGQREEAYLAYRNALKTNPESREAAMLLARLEVGNANRAFTSVDPGSVFDQEP